MINEYSKLFLIDAVSKYRNTEQEMLDTYCARTCHAHDDAADYLCAAVEAVLENGDVDFQIILNRAVRNGEKAPTEAELVEILKRRAKLIAEDHKPKFITVEKLKERLKRVEKKCKPLAEEDIKGSNEKIVQIEDDRKK